MMWGFGGYGFLWMALFWVGVVVLGVWAFRQTDQTRTRTRNRANEILEERFARGEIDAEELEARRHQLTR